MSGGLSIDARILRALRASEDGVSGEALAQTFGVTRAAVWARIDELRRVGYEIEANPHQGYRLVATPDRLSGDDLQAQMGPVKIVGRDIRVFQETTSTNDVSEKLGRDAVPEGVVVFAESQKRGRGRLGRSWYSPNARGLWFSVLLRPQLRPEAITQLTVMAATALCRAVEDVTALKADIKWPNDVHLRGRKLGGILVEMQAELDTVRYAVVGIGVNVNQEKREFPPELADSSTSLRIESGRAWDRGLLAARILEQLDADYRRIAEGQFDRLAEEWERRCTTLGRQVVIRVGTRRIAGRAESLGSDGALLVRTAHGHLERITGGDVSVPK